MADPKLRILINNIYRVEKQLSQPETEKSITTVSEDLERIYNKIVQMESERVKNLQATSSAPPSLTVVTKDDDPSPDNTKHDQDQTMSVETKNQHPGEWSDVSELEDEAHATSTTTSSPRKRDKNNSTTG